MGQSMKYLVGDQGIQKLMVSAPSEQHAMYSKMIYHAQQAKVRQTAPLAIDQAVAVLLLRIDPDRMDVLLQGGVLDDVPLPDPTELMHLLLGKKRLTCAFLTFLRKRGAKLAQVSTIHGCYPVHL